MLRHNAFACVRETSEGVRKPRFSTAARSGPYPLREPAGPTDGGPPRRPSFNIIGAVNTPVVVHSGRLNGAGSGASARGVIPNSSRQFSRLDGERATERAATASFNGMGAIEGAASGKGFIQQGVHSSGRELPSPRAASPQVFDSAEPDATASFAGMREVKVGASGRGVAEHRLSSSGSDGDSDGAPPAAVLGSIADDDCASFNDMGTVESGSSKRGVIDKEGESSECDKDVAPLAATGFRPSGEDKDVARTSSSRSLSALGFSGGGVGVIQAGASSKGLMTGDGLGENCSPRRSSARPHRNDFVLGTRALPQKGVQCVMFSSKSDGASSEVGSTTTGLRKIIRHGKSNEYEHDNLPPSEGTEVRADDISGAVRGAGGEASSGEFAFNRLKSRPSVENDVPERRGVAVLGSIAASPSSARFP